jgi:hypothetical protein
VPFFFQFSLSAFTKTGGETSHVALTGASVVVSGAAFFAAPQPDTIEAKIRNRMTRKALFFIS